MRNDSRLKVTAYIISILFAAIIILPLIYMISNSLQEESVIYDSKPRFIPRAAKSISVVIDYSMVGEKDSEKLKNLLLEDSTMALYSVPYELNTEAIYEIKMYGVKDGKTIFSTRAHKSQLTLEKDFGVYRRAVIKREVLLADNRYQKSAEVLGYHYNLQGIDSNFIKDKVGKNEYSSSIGDFLTEKYSIAGKYVGSVVSTNNLLMLENFKYYFKLPSYMYKDNKIIKNFGFGMFIWNTFIVIGWAIFIETIICSLTAYPLSRLFSKKISDLLTIFFVSTMMVPFISILVPQFMMFKSLGFYNNYAAMLLPFLYPYPFFILLYKGFFNQIPSSLYDAARIDGANEFYNYAVISMSLSKPIISLVALEVFLSNWNDFFWLWMVSEKQSLWTLNVALFNISRASSIKPNFLLGLSIITILPVILLSIKFSEQIKRSIAASGIKG